MKTNKFRIINKSKEKVIVLVYNKKLELTWKEFNENFVICKDNNKYCTITEDTSSWINKADYLVNKIIINTFEANSKKGNSDATYTLGRYLEIGSAAKELSQLLEISLQDVISLVRKRIYLLSGEINSGPKLDFHKIEKAASGKLTEANVCRKPQISQPTFASLPEMEKLKAMFNEETNKKDGE